MTRAKEIGCVVMGLLVVSYAASAMAAMEHKAPMSEAEKITSALSAAPTDIGTNATVMDWPAKEGAELSVLRKGGEVWTCLPDHPGTPGNDPMCFDRPAMEWAQAWMTKQQPHLKQPGLGYMLQGGSDASNTDPFATKPADGESWVNSPPHIMVFPSGELDMKMYGTEHVHGAPWVMFGGTPYAHLMIPVQ